MSLRNRLGTGIPSIILLAGTIVLLFLLIIAGAYDRRPLNQIFWLQADTRGIPNAPDGICHWTLYNFCDERDGKNFNCRNNNAANPFLPQRNFNTRANIPADFLNNPDRYFYLSRFLYSFYIIDLGFALMALLAGLLALSSRIGALAAAALSCLSLFFMTFSATIMTACFVLGQRAFRRAGRKARVGVKAFAFTWTCVALLGLATLGFLLAYLASRNKNQYRNSTPRTSRFAGMRRRRTDDRYTEKAGVDGYYPERSDSQRRLNPDLANQDVQLNAPALPVTASGARYNDGAYRNEI
ncbi:SUR7/PalI family-domain-containing protein [Morchella snyderi]|nr:SUR7/PalI family-domain-containing protein [Morchella snyderi]